ncbi:hypothetical protein [Streptomyces cucumeris]|uniref:hypothetical protein n=1 Tax=Streptomyces cucumeris TaxID=2962890 RepID=UPI0020C8CCAC|nr:hypothetical protein [Streptomyces sp. NEAU-Y11]MCP9209544.1 hypothetical protein [Streptomyces sp. NEAU-Y11]
MDLMSVAGNLSLEFGAVVEGPFGTEGHQVVKVWLPNRRGLSLSQMAGRDEPGTAELAVIRESVPIRGEESYGTPRRFDYSTPVTDDVVPGADLDRMRRALRTLGDMPDADPRDQRSTRPGASMDYPTGSRNGMSFIANRWVYTGPRGYRVVPNGDSFDVVSYNAAETRPVYGGQGLSEKDAHAMAQQLAAPRGVAGAGQ